MNNERGIPKYSYSCTKMIRRGKADKKSPNARDGRVL